jgi:hypothetical protein
MSPVLRYPLVEGVVIPEPSSKVNCERGGGMRDEASSDN